MADPIKDGGPAFARPGSDWMDGIGSRVYSDGARGMSLRDFFAAHAPMQTPPSTADVHWGNEIRVACEDLGVPCPDNGCIEDAPGFWFRVEAFRRYRYADAMLAAREARHE